MSKRKCTFNQELQSKFKVFITKPDLFKHEAFCTICEVKVSIANKGRYDLEQHIGSKKHTMRNGETSTKITSTFIPKFTKLDDKVAAAEGALAFHALKHHFSFRSTDCSTKLFKEIFNDSEIAKRLSSAHTKTRAIQKHVIAPFCIDSILSAIAETPFLSISTDGSNHGNIKIFPILIQYFTKEVGVQTKLIHLDKLPSENSETISNFLLQT